MKKINLFFSALFFIGALSAQTTSTFENLTLGVDTYWTGANLAGGFNNGNAYFKNVYDTAYGGYWSDGFVYSNKTDITTAGYTNPASAITGSGFASSQKYAVAYDGGTGNVRVTPTSSASGKLLQGVYVTNTTYAYLSMKNGDAFEHAFTRDSSDFYLLHISGWKGSNLIKDTVKFYLANFVTDSPGYIVNTWSYVSLRSLGDVDSLVFWVTGSQNSGFGLNTPAYFAIDNFVTSDIAIEQYTLAYNLDTLINVLASYPDTVGAPFTVSIISNLIPGASIAIDSNNLIFYVPQQGVVGTDTIIYTICNSAHQCDTGVVVLNLTAPTGISEINNMQAKVYPNPFNNFFTVQHSAGVNAIHLYDLQGRMLQQISCGPGETNTNIYEDLLSAGIYLVKIIANNSTAVTRIYKQ